MILRFGVSNFRSFSEYQELSLVASNIKEHRESLIETEAIKDKVLPLAGIYGPNASGKTNILIAMNFFRSGILKSHTRPVPQSVIQRTPYALNNKYEDIPTSMDCDFIYEGVRFHYGFSISNFQVEEEWLYSYPTPRKQVWFHRSKSEDEEFYFGSYLKGKNKTIASITRKDSLFLSSAALNNHEQLTGIQKFFEESFDFRISQEDVLKADLASYIEHSTDSYNIMKYISESDVGISSVSVSEESDDAGVKAIEELKKALTGVQEKHSIDIRFEPTQSRKKIKFGHQSNSGENVFFELSHESRGTVYLVALLGQVFDALKHGKTLIVDELDNSLHPTMCKKIISMFTSNKSNPHGAQLIFTTHDTSLMSTEIMRRDEVWFTEKDDSGSTRLYPLTDIKTRSTDNLEKGYLQGRYGGVPILTGLESFFR